MGGAGKLAVTGGVHAPHDQVPSNCLALLIRAKFMFLLSFKFEHLNQQTVRATFTLALSSAGCNRLGPTAEGTCSPLPDNQQGAILR